MTPVALMTGRSEYSSDCCKALLDELRQAFDPLTQLGLFGLAAENRRAQRFQSAPRG